MGEQDDEPHAPEAGRCTARARADDDEPAWPAPDGLVTDPRGRCPPGAAAGGTTHDAGIDVDAVTGPVPGARGPQARMVDIDGT